MLCYGSDEVVAANEVLDGTNTIGQLLGGFCISPRKGIFQEWHVPGCLVFLLAHPQAGQVRF